MFRITKTEKKAKSGKQTGNRPGTGRRRAGKGHSDPQKGRGGRARETIREQPPPPRKTKRQPNAGPPLKIGGGSAKKHVTGTTPEEVVRNIRRQKR